MRCVAVPGKKAPNAISMLLSRDCIDKRYRIEKVGDMVLIPIAPGGCDFMEDTVECNPVPRSVLSDPYPAIRDILLKRGIAEDQIPSRWVRYGRSIVIRTSSERAREIGDVFLRYFHARSVYNNDGRIHGIFRTPEMTLLAGEGGEIIHRENGIYYIFDPERIMFSPGNVNERIRYSRIRLDGKRVLDMFAGIGYFTLPLAVYSGASHITAVDLNPDAIAFLRRAASKNGVDDIVETVVADSRFLNFSDEFDFIVMGNFDSPQFASASLNYSKRGGLISMHHLVRSRERDDPTSVLRRIFGEDYAKVELIESHKVKSYGPQLYHYSTLLRRIW